MRVRLRDSLSNRETPLFALVAALEGDGPVSSAQVDEVMRDPAAVTEARQNRMLSPAEVDELVALYERGATERSLAARFGAHRQTVSEHLKRAGVVKRPKTKMTESMVSRARELYEQGWSGPRISRALGINVDTIYKALKRAGVRMRSPVAERRKG